MKEDIIEVNIRFHPKKDTVKISFRECSDKNFPENDIATYDVIEFKLKDLFSKGVESAANLLGKSVMVLASELGWLKADELAGELSIDDELNKITSVLEERSNKGDVKAMELLGSHYEMLSVRNANKDMLDKAEKYYKLAIENGSSKIREYMDGEWENNKKTYIAIIEKKRRS